jgi:hypothetical protein
MSGFYGSYSINNVLLIASAPKAPGAAGVVAGKLGDRYRRSVRNQQFVVFTGRK